ncbi:acyltransferase family protein [Desulfovibrio sp. TomC]|uniref:acyltransferase family protein n=1 Tax=Desulfovibrio sp. TomC TaxID=1562888 RepID=UPI0005758E49|nr:acyltransferase [Desulfovibrio sp. TomC]KHK01242.1 acyltransferase 3 [Desulfovibrio sp. TomC]
MQRRVTQIESIRVLAMFGIFFYHLWTVLPDGGAQNPFGPILGDIMSQGYLGVVVFNAITGFVLTLPHANPGGKPPLAYFDFFRRRFGRITPQYYLSLALWSVVALIAGAMPLAALGACVAEKLFFVQTFDPARFFCLEPALWWMGLLAQFYLTFPLLLRLFTKYGPARTTIGCLASGWGLWIVLSLLAKVSTTAALFDYMLYFNLPYRLPEFALGMAFALVWKARAAALRDGDPETGIPTSWLVGFLAATYLALPLAIVFKAHLPAILAHILLTIVCLGLAGSLFSWPAMARLGAKPVVSLAAATSYSFYLLHQPILGYGANLLKSLPPFAAMCLLAVVSLPVSYTLSRWQDRIVAKFEARGK